MFRRERPQIADRLQRLLCLASPTVKARIDVAHEGQSLVEGKLKAGGKDGAATSWDKLYPEAETTGDQSRGPYDIKELPDGRWRVRILLPESGDIIGGTGATVDEALGALERKVSAMTAGDDDEA